MKEKNMRSIFQKLIVKVRGLQWQIHRRFKKFTTVSSQQGLLAIQLGADDYLGKHLYTRGQYELEIVTWSLELLRSIDKCPVKGKGTVVDIGANNGVISIGMLYCGEFEKAIAIEPEPQNFNLLLQNIKNNSLNERVIPLQYAVSDKAGEVVFEISDNNSGDHRVRVQTEAPDRFHESKRPTINVKSDSLENLLQKIPQTFIDDIVLFWIDVQGYEGFIFSSAKDIFLRGTPVVTELWPYGISRAGMTKEQYCTIAEGIWSSYWVRRKQGFVEYPINTLAVFFEELGNEGDFDNIILV